MRLVVHMVGVLVASTVAITVWRNTASDEVIAAKLPAMTEPIVLRSAVVAESDGDDFGAIARIVGRGTNMIVVRRGVGELDEHAGLDDWAMLAGIDNDATRGYLLRAGPKLWLLEYQDYAGTTAWVPTAGARSITHSLAHHNGHETLELAIRGHEVVILHHAVNTDLDTFNDRHGTVTGNCATCPALSHYPRQELLQVAGPEVEAERIVFDHDVNVWQRRAKLSRR
jgi:hypothetical protein